MQITDKLVKPISETKYLSADNVQRYRVIIRYFYIQYEKVRYWLYKEDVFNELSKHELFAEYSIDQCKNDLAQLTEWRNLIAAQDTAKVNTIEDFKNKQFRYQLSEYSVEIERMTLKLENLFIEGASLEPTLLERLRNELAKINTIKHSDELTIYAWWDVVNTDFIRLNQNCQDYIRDLNSVHAEEMMKTREFLLFKDKLVEYLRSFIKSLQKNLAAIEHIVGSVSQEDLHFLLNKVVQHELSIPRLDIVLSEYDVREMIYGRWESIEAWFLTKNGVQNEALKLFDATNDMIRRITRYAAQISEIYTMGANRKEEYRKLCEIFSKCESLSEAHKLSALVFGVERPVHLKGDFYRSTDSIYSGVYDEPPFEVGLVPRIRSYKESVSRSGIRDFKQEKEQLMKELMTQFQREQELLEGYSTGDEIDFAKLPVIEPETRAVLLIWLSKGLEAGNEKVKTDNGRFFYIDRSNCHNTVEINCTDGIFVMPGYKIIFEQSHRNRGLQ